MFFDLCFVVVLFVVYRAAYPIRRQATASVHFRPEQQRSLPHSSSSRSPAFAWKQQKSGNRRGYGTLRGEALSYAPPVQPNSVRIVLIPLSFFAKSMVQPTLATNSHPMHCSAANYCSATNSRLWARMPWAKHLSQRPPWEKILNANSNYMWIYVYIKYDERVVWTIQIIHQTIISMYTHIWHMNAIYHICEGNGILCTYVLICSCYCVLLIFILSYPCLDLLYVFSSVPLRAFFSLFFHTFRFVFLFSKAKR